jgi:trigger factor
MEATAEELGNDRVRLTVEVPVHDLKHAVEHAAGDLAESVKIPGFRKGKIPMPVLVSKLGKERIFGEAVSTHIGGWFSAAAAKSRVRPVSRPQYEFDLPGSSDEPWTFTAEFSVQAKAAVPDWTTLEVGVPDPSVPEELIQREVEELQRMVAELIPVEGRGAQAGDTLVVDLVDPAGEGQRDLVLELGIGRVLPALEQALQGMKAGDERVIDYPTREGEEIKLTATVKDLKEKVLPPADDELAKAASEFDTFAELRADLEARLKEQLEREIETDFRISAADALAKASKVAPADTLVETRASDLINARIEWLRRRGLAPELYLQATGITAQQFVDEARAEAYSSLARELALEAVAEKLGVDVSDEELRDLVRQQLLSRSAENEEIEDIEAAVDQVLTHGGANDLRDDMRLSRALDRVVAEVKRIPMEVAAAREAIWTPEKEQQEKIAAAPKLWTPGS